MPSLLVIGAGGHAKMVIAAARAAGFDTIHVFDDDRRRWGRQILGATIYGPIVRSCGRAATPAVIAIGDSDVRGRLAESLALNWTVVRHPFSYVDPSAVVGPGTVIAAGAVVQPDAVLGRHSVVNTGASIDHDCWVGDFVTTGPGVRLAGGVTIGDGALLGVGCCVKPGCRIGAGTIVGAGSVVVGDLPDRVVAFGVPARVQNRVDPCRRAG